MKQTTWIDGEPTEPGWYLLEFSGGDRFVVVRAFYEEKTLCMEDQSTGGYVHDVVDVIVRHLRIPQPK